MSQAVIKRLRAALAGSRGITVELPKAFIVEVIEAMDAAPPAVDLDALVRKQREWNDQVIKAYLQAGGQTRVAQAPRYGGLKTRCIKTRCIECEGDMFVMATRVSGRRMMCLGCKRRVTVKGDMQPERA